VIRISLLLGIPVVSLLLGQTVVSRGTVRQGGTVPWITEAAPMTIARTGLYNGKTASAVNIAGKRISGWNSTNILGDCSAYLDTTQDANNSVDGGTTYYIRSSSVNDTAAGTGAQTVRVVSLNTAGVQQVATWSMDGTTAVSLGSGYRYFEWAEVATIGTANGFSLGNITISNVTGAPLVNEIFELIPVASNHSLSARYMVPSDSTAYLTSWQGSATGGATQDTRLIATVFADNRAISPGVFHYQGIMFIQNATNFYIPLDRLTIPANAEIKFASISSAAGAANDLNCEFDMLLVKN